MKSLAHPGWPYAGTPNEWRGFAEKTAKPEERNFDLKGYYILHGVYQKQNLGPELK